MIVVVNALPTAPGGGLTNLRGLLEGFDAVPSPVERFVVVAAHEETLAAAHGLADRVHRAPLMGALRRMRWERRHLPGLLEREGADLLLANNFAVPGLARPQVVHHQNLHTLGGWTMWGSVRRAPKVAVQKAAARFTLRVARANVFTSHYLRRHAERAYPPSRGRNHVIPYGLSPRYRACAQRPDRGEAVGCRLAALQSPLGHKDNESLLRALRLLVERRPDRPWRLRLAGWRDWTPWRRRARALGIADRVEWMGYLDEAGVIDLLSTSDCMVFPSVFESFGLPVIEAMACGCPVVAVDATAVPEVAAGAAHLVPPRSPRALADAVARVCLESHHRRRLVAAGHRRARDFSWQVTARRFTDVFCDVARPLTMAA